MLTSANHPTPEFGGEHRVLSRGPTFRSVAGPASSLPRGPPAPRKDRLLTCFTEVVPVRDGEKPDALIVGNHHE